MHEIVQGDIWNKIEGHPVFSFPLFSEVLLTRTLHKLLQSGLFHNISIAFFSSISRYHSFLGGYFKSDTFGSKIVVTL